MSDHRVRARCRRAALLQLAAEEVRRSAQESEAPDAPRLAKRLEELAARLLVGRQPPVAA